MEKPISPCPVTADWKALYRAAISETDHHLISQKVAEAEKAAFARSRELFYTGGAFEEREAIEEALYALGALKTAWQFTQAA